ncbi:programmed cell death protein 4-like isoform X2 [Sycon ciliatum]|uniref:programmed cell death protein 4-like isoform X2 n=1 Tax=Sycon ciliatum TaxID=27933 RepID=UPI0020ADD8E0
MTLEQQHCQISVEKHRAQSKSEGGGGKGTWGKITDVLDGKAAADSKDPNYDSSTEDEIVISESSPVVDEADVASIVLPLFKEYCSHGKSEDIRDSLEQYNFCGVEPQIIISIIEYALEHTSYMRELTSILISDLYGVTLCVDDYVSAFTNLLDNLEELCLDTPDCAVALGKFMARSIADDCLPPAFIKSFDIGERTCVKESIEHANLLLGMSHGLVRLDSVWGPVLGGLRPVKTLERDMNIILQEYVSSGQLDECARCLKQLNVPHFHHEFVYLAVMLVMEGDQPQVHESIAKCLKYLCDQQCITQAQLERGFVRVFENVEDIRLDVPFVYSVLSSFGARCQSSGVISKDIYDQIPTRNRQRFISDSEGDTYVEEVPVMAK